MCLAEMNAGRQSKRRMKNAAAWREVEVLVIVWEFVRCCDAFGGAFVYIKKG